MGFQSQSDIANLENFLQFSLETGHNYWPKNSSKRNSLSDFQIRIWHNLIIGNRERG